MILKHIKDDNIEEIVQFGPVQVNFAQIGENTNLKLVRFCHKVFPDLSRRLIHECFKKGYVYKNSLSMTENDETVRVKDGDSVHIMVNRRELIVHSELFETLKVIVETQEYALIEKPPGIECLSESLFAWCYRLKLWGSNYYRKATPLFLIEKALGGLMIVAKNEDQSIILFNKFISTIHPIKLSCVISKGESFAESTSIQIPLSDFEVLATLEIQVTREVRSRSHNFISMCDVYPLFKNRSAVSTLEEMRMISKSLSLEMKRLKTILQKQGFPIVGHDDHVVKGRGIFADWNEIKSFSSSLEVATYRTPIQYQRIKK
jgi:hypothetical protein